MTRLHRHAVVLDMANFAERLRTLRSQPRRILYVACAADSLARDLGVLCANGYRVTAARLCDLFPHTEHVELVVRLDAAGG